MPYLLKMLLLAQNKSLYIFIQTKWSLSCCTPTAGSTRMTRWSCACAWPSSPPWRWPSPSCSFPWVCARFVRGDAPGEKGFWQRSPRWTCVCLQVRRAIQQMLFPTKAFHWLRHIGIALLLLFVINMLVIFAPNILGIFGIIGKNTAASWVEMYKVWRPFSF